MKAFWGSRDPETVTGQQPQPQLLLGNALLSHPQPQPEVLLVPKTQERIKRRMIQEQLFEPNRLLHI